MLDTNTMLDELSTGLTRMQKIVQDLRTKLPHDDAGWLDAAKDVLVSARVPAKAGVTVHRVPASETCDICGEGPFKNELGLQIHQGRQHKKELARR